MLLSGRSRQRGRLHATGLSICLLLCLLVCLSPKCENATFFSKTKQFTAMVSIDDLQQVASRRPRLWRCCTARLERPACWHRFCTVTGHFQAALEDLSVWTIILLTTDLVTCFWSSAYGRIILSLIIIIIIHGLLKEPIIGPLKYKMAEICHLGSLRRNAKTGFSQKN